MTKLAQPPVLSLNRYFLKFQKNLFDLEAVGEPAQAVGTQDAVAGNHEHQWIGAYRIAHRAVALGAQHLTDLFVRGGVTVRDFPQPFPNPLLKWCALQSDGPIELNWFSLKVLFQICCVRLRQ